MSITRRIRLDVLVSLAAVMVVSMPASAQQQKPNVVFILADNVGYGDLGPYGGGELRGAPTPRIDQLAREGLRLTQYLVEPGCTPSRAALMTGQYSIRNGLSLIIVPDSPSTLSARAFTMGELFKSVGYATAIFGKWHLGIAPESLPTAHGFDEFYGIPPDISWDSATYVDTIELTHSISEPPDVLLAKGPQIYEAVAGEPLRKVKPYTREVRAEIDTELVAKSIDFMKRQRAAGRPFFLYLPFSMGHFPNLPSKQFAGKSRIGQFGDKLMEGDYHVGQILDALKELGVDDNTLVVFASDNGPQGETSREMGNQGTPDMGNSGPFRGELGEATEGSIRTFCFVRWPAHVKPGTISYAMFSIMDFFPTFARIIGANVPTDRPIDGVDQTDVLLGKSEAGNRDSLLTFIGADLVAVRWKQWRFYFTDVHPTGIGPQRQPGIFSASAPMAGYPKVYNIEMGPHEDLQVGALFGWTAGPALAISFAILYRIGGVTPRPYGATATSTPIRWSIANTDCLLEDIAVDTFCVSSFGTFVMGLFHGLFTARSWQSFTLLACGWALTTDRHTITTYVWLTGAITVKHFSRFYVFLGCPLYTQRRHLWGAVIRRAAHFVPEGEVITIAFDDTTKKKAGRQIEGLGRYRNGAGSARQEYRTLRGLNFVVGIMRVPLPRWPEHSLSVPIGLELYLKPDQAKALHVPYRSRSQLARDILDFVAAQVPGRPIRSLADGGYATKDYARQLPETAHVVGRLPVNAKLYALPPTPTPKRRGAPRKKGDLIGSPKTLAQLSQGWAPHPNEAGAEIQAWCGLWHAGLPGRLVRVVVLRRERQRAPTQPGQRKPPPAIEAFFTTDLTLSAHDIVHEYSDRWAVEITIRDSNAFDGLGQDQCRKRQRIIGANTFRLVMAAARTLWFLDQVTCGTMYDLHCYRPWYRQKVAPSQLDVVWACREALHEAGIFPIPRFTSALTENPEEPEHALPLAA